MKKGIVLTLTIVMAFIVVGSWYVYYVGHQPMAKAEKEATEIAKQEADLKEVDQFYWYNGVETYFTITGTNQKDEKIIVIIAKKGGKTQVIKQSDTISESDARKLTREAKNPKRILETRIGLEKDIPIWEVVYKEENGRLGYHILKLKDGEYIRDISNI
ncbi:cell wall elongation regulator TseB-like domain-containing protein [Carnobacterium gallinarum]|uniref:cell wall elongation regulator TseB-like domain-containing protein n=1 Tax=Carnobacterium gallinarum TaxID=2749 RepID=UPI00054EAFC1|nr:DUF5590 domain-containing protein [Carnobacterium gallinarum]